MRSRGRLSTTNEGLYGALNRGLGEGNLQEKALGIGDPTSGSRAAGKQNAVWASIPLTGVTTGTFDIPHTLGTIPVAVTLMSWENTTTPTTQLVARDEQRKLWSRTAARVVVTATAGALAGSRAHFLVRGR